MLRTALVCTAAIMLVAGIAQAGLESMSEADRSKSLAETLRNSGKACSEATRTFYMGKDADSAAYWSVACEGGGPYIVQVPPVEGAKTRIMECELARMIGISCFEKLE